MKDRARHLLNLVLLLVSLSACSMGDMLPEHELSLFAASSLTDAFDELSTAFEAQHPGVRVVRNYAGSSQLAAQILNGVPVDVFAPASPDRMQDVVDAGLADGPPVDFASNQLTIIVPADNPAGIETLADLAFPGVALVLAVPGVPVRDYTDSLLDHLRDDPVYGSTYADMVYRNLVSEESNVRQVAAKVALGEADAGIVYTSDRTPDIMDDVLLIPIPEEFNVIADYPIAVLRDSHEPELAQAFVDFVLSPEGQAIVQSWGFGPSGGSAPRLPADD